ncbi:hypothetical protein [Thalassococcus sp. S3]|uniref:DUF6950 family protein n=1 Tax=Thalassococcus sp. S3 TaxID=2017482 RepID=UPI001023F968|nr:hypothetical protein [Thalassococcus sp. S3]QBF31489.1 hypothetical protein CFI11_09700 [Thalassococcus sp. S3]
MTRIRPAGWQNRLIAYVGRSVQRPFEEGVNDCALFLAGGVEAIRGTDYAAPYRGRYRTIAGGIRILRKAGFDDHVALAAHHLDEIPPAYLTAGDGAMVRTADGPALGIVQGHSIYLLGRKGMRLAPLLVAVRGFAV